MFAAMRTIGKNSSISKRPRQPNAGRPITLLFRWGVWVCYTEWRPDQPHEDWSGGLTVSGGTLRSPRQVMYHGCWGAQRRTFIELPESRWESPLIHFPRPLYGYKGLEGLAVNVEGDANTILHFRSAMLDTDIRLGDIPDGDWLTIPAGSKYSCSQLVVCRMEDEGIYWNAPRTAAESARTGRQRMEITRESFRGTFVPREVHHRTAAWIPPNGTVEMPLTWEADGPVVITWRFTGLPWAARSDSVFSEMSGGCNSPQVALRTALDGRLLTTGRYKAKYMRGANSGLEHTDEATLTHGEHILSITNTSQDTVYLALYSVTVQQTPPHWAALRECLPFQAPWFDGNYAVRKMSGDLPSGGRGLVLGYDTNMMAAENGWIDAAIRFMAATGGGNYLLFRTETDAVSRDDWRRWFLLCREHHIFFAINTSMPNLVVPLPELLAMAHELGGGYFLGKKHHELSIPLYSGWRTPGAARTLAEAEADYLEYVRKIYGTEDGTPRLLGEAALAHRYAYRAGVNLILSETMTGNTSILLSEARGAARAFGKSLWGMHIACHVHCSPEDYRHERMFWLNLYLGYLAGASLIEDEEGGLAKVHSFVSGPTDPLPLARQSNIAAFFRWAQAHPRTAPLQVETGLFYGRHEAITGGMSLNTGRPVRVWDGFGPNDPSWEYGEPEHGWLLADLFLPGVWLCPVLQEKNHLRRWFAGTPYGQVDLVPSEADAAALSGYKLLVLPGWHTMCDDDMNRLENWVAEGGTLVMALPHLQTSDDRTAVLTGGKRAFPDPARVARLCGLRVAGPGATVAEGMVFGEKQNLTDPRHGPLRLAEIELKGGRTTLTVEGHPLLVEHAVGRGTVFTFTTWSYFGHRGLLGVARLWLEGLLERFPFDVRLRGGDGEIAYYVYPEGDHRRIYLINTDWTVPGNVKRCTVLHGNATVEVNVAEGQVTEITL
jgi:hypothetical protein